MILTHRLPVCQLLLEQNKRRRKKVFMCAYLQLAVLGERDAVFIREVSSFQGCVFRVYNAVALHTGIIVEEVKGAESVAAGVNQVISLGDGDHDDDDDGIEIVDSSDSEDEEEEEEDEEMSGASIEVRAWKTTVGQVTLSCNREMPEV